MHAHVLASGIFVCFVCVCRIPTPLDSQKGKMEVDQGSRERMRGGKVME